MEAYPNLPPKNNNINKSKELIQETTYDSIDELNLDYLKRPSQKPPAPDTEYGSMKQFRDPNDQIVLPKVGVESVPVNPKRLQSHYSSLSAEEALLAQKNYGKMAPYTPPSATKSDSTQKLDNYGALQPFEAEGNYGSMEGFVVDDPATTKSKTNLPPDAMNYGSLNPFITDPTNKNLPAEALNYGALNPFQPEPAPQKPTEIKNQPKEDPYASISDFSQIQ